MNEHSPYPPQSPGASVCRSLVAGTGGEAVGEGVARADLGKNIGGRFASDEAVKDHVLSLIDKDVHFTLSLGLWMAFLSRGPLSGALTTNEFGDGPQSPDQAATRVGTGRGLLRGAGAGLFQVRVGRG